MKLNYAIGSDRGLVRGNNEDSAYAGPHLLALADGMGGHAAGEVASQLMINHLLEIDADPGDNDMLAILGSVADDANHAIARGVKEVPETNGMGTTLTSLMFNGKEFGLCHVGDSRGYRLRNGTLEQLTVDDTYVQSLIDRGELDPEDVSTHPQRSMILKAYTGRPVEPTLKLLDAQIGDRILLCSDGLSDPVTASTIENELGRGTPAEAVTRLIELALRSGGPDNVTVVVADVVKADSQQANTLTPVTAGALNAGQPEDPRPDTAAGRAAIALAQPAPTTTITHPAASETIEPVLGEADALPDFTTIKKRRRFLPLILLICLCIIGAGIFVGYNTLKDRYYVHVNDAQQIVINQGFEGVWSKPYQASCLNAEGNLTLIDIDSTDKCHRFKVTDLKGSARSSVEALTGGSYDNVLQQMQRLSQEILPVCVTRESNSSSNTHTKKEAGNLNTPGVNCREVK
ncbi:MAG: protein phosphatase 2C domain-containing protein [Corynebacterium sp.]|uniref:PP2C family protein-serine/threonine phosphatase n=1 Tax=Corynebacterium sp. TaxID=1720 RepID=UPI0026DD73C8|nr:protein phosphatase 2C domain-containing protein [Corynebacterium sp.]MDO4761790.1 protein phosphatase 2C domain-containing protein [Corynebacterium sp.]